MFGRTVVLGLVAMGGTAWAAESSPPLPKPQGPTASRSGYLPINGLKLYYEVYGDLGKSKTAPLLLIPGAFLSADSMRPWVAAFAAKRPVIVFDQQGHGRTADTSRKMSYEQFGDDAAALLRALKVERADVMGYSQGGGVALQLALRHPTLVNKLVSLSAAYRENGWYPARSKALEGLNAKVFAGSPIEGAFKKHTPEQFYDVAYQLIIIPEHVYGGIPVDQLRTSEITRKPIGTGRFRFVRWDPGTRIELIKRGPIPVL